MTLTLFIRLPGQVYDKESGLHYNYFRDYDPSLGRYGESDPVGLKAGLNTYLYAQALPVCQFSPQWSQFVSGVKEPLNFRRNGASIFSA